MAHIDDSIEPHLSLSAAAARNLATATVTVPQWAEITPRWLHKLLPWIDIDGGVYRVNRVAKAAKGKPANEFGESRAELLTVDGGEPRLPTTFVDYVEDPREYHLSTIQTVVQTHTRVTGEKHRGGRRDRAHRTGAPRQHRSLAIVGGTNWGCHQGGAHR